MKRNTLHALPAVLLLAACDAPTLPGPRASDVYAYHIDTDPPSILRWETGSVIRVYIAGGTPARVPVMQGAFDKAAVMWNGAVRYGEYRLEQATSLQQADVVLRWSDDLAPVDMSGCQPEISRAVTTFCLNENDATRLHVYPLVGADAGVTSRVRMIVSIIGSEAAATARVERLVAHELGHVLGLGQHSSAERDIMLANPVAGALSERDRATVRVLYHTRPHITP